MLQFFRKLFCLHAYEFDYHHQHGYTQECRKCGKHESLINYCLTRRVVYAT